MTTDIGRTIAASTDHAIVLTRTFDAPRELVFRMWTEPEHFKRWFGPETFTIPHVSIDARVGGVLHYCMRSPTGQDYWARSEFREVSPPERIVMTDSFSDAEGNIVSGAEYGVADMPLVTMITVTFEERDGKTLMTLRHDIAGTVESRGGTQEGWAESLEKLAAALRR